MKIQQLSKFLAIVAWSVSALAQAGDMAGYWLIPSDDHRSAIIEIDKVGETYEGRIAALEQPEYPQSEGPALAGKTKLDRKNSDPAQRGQSLVGLTILSAFQADGPGKWDSGRIYDPEDGRIYHCKAWISEDGRQLSVRGYVGISLLGQTQQWTRVAAPVFPVQAY